MRKHFTAVAMLVCTVQQVRDPLTGKQGWLAKCRKDDKAMYLPMFVRGKKTAIRKAQEWLNAYRPKNTISVQELRQEYRK